MTKRQRVKLHKKRTARQQKQAEKRLVRNVERRLMMSKSKKFLGIDRAARGSRSSSMVQSFATHYGKPYLIDYLNFDKVRKSMLEVSKEMMSRFNALAKTFRLGALG